MPRDNGFDLGHSAADDVGAAVHHHLRRPDIVVAEALLTGALAAGEGVLAECVLPAQLVPVGDVEAQGQKVGPGR